jgi:hypothetical protein
MTPRGQKVFMHEDSIQQNTSEREEGKSNGKKLCDLAESSARLVADAKQEDIRNDDAAMQ